MILDELVRAQTDAPQLRETSDGGMPTMIGHFAPFNQWSKINSALEGKFLERIAPGAFARTFKNNRDKIRVLFQHGRDPVVGNKPLGRVQTLEEDQHGARYEVPLLDTSYNRDLLPGLRAGLYGASFRFGIVNQHVDDNPKRSDHNPDGIPERTIKEARVMEFGPVTFPAYAGASAGVRSMTDEFLLDRLATSGRLAELVPHVIETTRTAKPTPLYGMTTDADWKMQPTRPAWKMQPR